MIEIRDIKDKIVADTGKEKYYYDSWDEAVKDIPEIKKSPEEKVYVREGNRLERVRF